MRKINQILSHAIRPPRTNFEYIYYRYSEFLLNYNWVNFSLNCSDGAELPVVLLTGKILTVDWPIVVYTHSYGSNKFEGSDLIQTCYWFDCDLVFYDSWGSGLSGPDPIGFGCKEKTDLLYLLLKLVAGFGYQNIILWGRSIGCNAIIQMFHELIQNEGEFINRVRLSNMSK